MKGECGILFVTFLLFEHFVFLLYCDLSTVLYESCLGVYSDRVESTVRPQTTY